MADIYDILLSAVGGCLVLISNYILENRKKKKDELIEYRKELEKNMDKIILPIYTIFDELWNNLIMSIDFDMDPPKIKEGVQLVDSKKDIINARKKLNDFIDKNGVQLNLLFPPEMQGWKLIRLCAGVNEIINKIDAGENPVDELNSQIAECVDYQRNMQILLGFNFNESRLSTHLDKQHSIRGKLYNKIIYKYSLVVSFIMILIFLFVNMVYFFNIDQLFFVSKNIVWLYVITDKYQSILFILYWIVILLGIIYKSFYIDYE